MKAQAYQQNNDELNNQPTKWLWVKIPTDGMTSNGKY